MPKNKTTSFQFPLEDDYSITTAVDERGFYRTSDIKNDILIKAPFNGKIKSVSTIPLSEDELPQFLKAEGFVPEVRSMRLELVSEFGDEFYVFGILPSDKAKNIGISFKSGENIGRVKLNNPRNFTYKYTRAPIVDSEGNETEPSEDSEVFTPIESIKQEAQKEEAKEEALKDLTLLQKFKALPFKNQVAVGATIIVSAITASVVYRIVKG